MSQWQTYVRGGVTYRGEGARAAGGIIAKPSDVVTWARMSTARISLKYMLATALHETTYAVNEVDVEPSGFVSRGLYQVSQEEAAKVGMPGANLLDPVQCTLVFARLAEKNYDVIVDALPPALRVVFNARIDRWAYLAIAHNEGVGHFAPALEDGRHSGALVTIYNYGVNWGDPSVPAEVDDPRSYRRRNAGRPIVRYGDDCITGGPHWPQVPAVYK